jgi:uncharacterized PurR-regulated membrane protein YhhQ (DUF165 family)
MAVELEEAVGKWGKDQDLVVERVVAMGMVTAAVLTFLVMAGTSPGEAEAEAEWAVVVATTVESAPALAPAGLAALLLALPLAVATMPLLTAKVLVVAPATAPMEPTVLETVAVLVKAVETVALRMHHRPA